jgi:aldose 1-epimerase
MVKKNSAGLSVSKESFGTLPSGEKISQYLLQNVNGMTAAIMNYGATLISLKLPNAQGKMSEITLGFNKLEDYLAHEFYFGATIGRVANRISNAEFHYQGTRHPLTRNYQEQHHIHGGVHGFDKVVWEATIIEEENAVGLKLFYFSKEGEEGYPGNVAVITSYLLNNNNELKISFWAKADQPTPLDLTNHTYWNLAGAGSGDILNHILHISADEYIVTNEAHIPTGEIKAVNHGPVDFRIAMRIGDRIQQVGGYDLCYVVRPSGNHLHRLPLAAAVIEPTNDRKMHVYTSQRGLQFYSGNYLTSCKIADNKKLDKHGGLCFETQNFPDAVNHPNFPSPILLPDQIYQHETIYKLTF